MKPRILLHIGRHKTGTTALQNFFYYNRERMADRLGVFYPQTYNGLVAHHAVGELFARQRVKSDADLARAISHPASQQLLAEIAGAGTPWVLVSSESFQNADPLHVRELFKGHEVQIVITLRNQADYLASAFAQRVHATTATLSLHRYGVGFLRLARYARYIRPWASAFSGLVSVGLYETHMKSERGLVADFLSHHLGPDNVPPLEDFDTASGNRNMSLSAPITIYKWRLNHVLPQNYQERQQLYFLLMQLSQEPAWAQRFSLDRKRRLLVWLYCYLDNRRVSQQYLKQQNVYAWHDAGNAPAEMPYLSDEMHDAINERVISELPSLAAYRLEKATSLGAPW